MAELKNEFTWSFSRRQTFESCRRRYWFRYYAFWGGWNRDAPELARKAYFFSKMASLAMLVGTAVHETIADVLRALRSRREPASPFEQVRARTNGRGAPRRRSARSVQAGAAALRAPLRRGGRARDDGAARELTARAPLPRGDDYRSIVAAGPASFPLDRHARVTSLAASPLSRPTSS
jgi:hypothetical protein